MYSTALSLTLPDVSAEQHAALLADAPLLSLYEAFAAVPDPRSRHGQRYDLPYLLTCLVAARLVSLQLEGLGGTMVSRPAAEARVDSLGHATSPRPPARSLVGGCPA